MADRVTIIVIAGHHSFSGKLENRGVRVLDLVNSPSTEFLQLSEVAVHQSFFEGIIKQLPEATIPKSVVDFVLLDQAKHEAPIRRQHALVEKRSHSAYLVLGEYEIRGNLMLKGSPNAVGAITRELSAYFPLTSASLSMVGSAEKPVPAGVALVNKSKVTLISIEQQAARLWDKAIS